MYRGKGEGGGNYLLLLLLLLSWYLVPLSLPYIGVFSCLFFNAGFNDNIIFFVWFKLIGSIILLY